MRSFIVAHIADSHFDASENGRLGECIRVHNWMAEDMARRKVDLIVHAGDLYERESVPKDRNAAVSWVQKCGDIAPTILVRGNHDAHRDLEVLRKIKARHRITVEERASVHHVSMIQIACLAWPNKAQILADLPPCSPDTSSAVAADAIRDVLRGFAGEFEKLGDGPRILLCHAMVRAAKASTGQPLVGCDMEIGVEDLALARADYVALGHIHKGQDWTIAETDDHHAVPVVYPGSVRRSNYGEAEVKGYALAEFHHHEGELTQPDARRWGAVDWQWIEAPVQRMIFFEDEWGRHDLPDDMHEDGWSVGNVEGIDITRGIDEQIPGSDIRIRYRVGGDKREAAKIAANEWRDRLLEQGAERVKVDERLITRKRARAPEVAAANTTADKLEAMWDHRGDMPPARRPRLLEKLATLKARAKVAS